MHNDTITAIATPLGESALGIIRISGYQAINILKKIFRPTSSTDISQAISHSVHHGYIFNPNDSSTYMDEALVTLMRAPRSYTREDTVEISGHGNPLILDRILDNVISAGARPAEPGEFTKRAFLNGRIDLTQAEAVMDLINSRTDQASKAVLQHLKGNMSICINWLQHSLKEILTSLEAAIDFPEDNTDKLDISHLKEKLKGLLAKINSLIATYSHGKILKEGIITAIIGRANVGKSSLFNILTEDPDRALVTHIPGTTRDIIEKLINLDGRLFRIMDTAGLKSPRGIIEKESLKITLNCIKNSIFNIFIIDGSKALSQKDLEIASEAIKKPTLIVINKIDLKQRISIDKLIKHFPKNLIILISCKENKGIEKLKDSLLDLSEKIYPKSQSDSEILLTNSRHKNLLKKTTSSIKDALTAIQKRLPPEFISSDLRQALENLQEITGERVTEDILNAIFSKFCIGK